jgi:membrane-bound lytic murein transglycosylase D
MLIAALVLGGCATAPRPSTSSLDTAGSSEAETPDGLAQAQMEYYAGVRAYVAEDLDDAEAHFSRVYEALAFAGSEAVADLVARDAESLLAKADYFLGKIADARYTEDGSELATGAPPADPQAGWKVTHGEIHPVTNRDVDRWIHYFTHEGRDVFQRWLLRMPQYEPIYAQSFARHGLPPEIIYHSMIESGFSTKAYSWAHAVGLWQFVRTTGKHYGLRVDWWVDERRDPYLATEAACQYLAELHEEFGDWELALAAYNVGEGRIRKQIRRQNTRNFWDLRLPRETRNHVPKFYAAMILGTEAEKYGFERGSGSFPEWETVSVDFCVDFDVLGECSGASAEALAELNPALVRNCSPPDEKGFQVRVPRGAGEAAQVAIAAIPEDQRVRWMHHRVRNGETLSHIADRYRTTITAIAEANRLRSRNFLSVGQELLIPQGRSSGSNPPSWASAGTPSSGSGNKTTYVVRKGDTVSQIAERHGVSASRLRSWNRLGRFIYPGQKLTIHGGKSVASSGGSSSRSSSHKVRRGDTLWEIARRNGVSLTSLLQANNLRRNAVIRPGDVLRIP